MSPRPYHKVESTIWTQGWDNDTLLLAFYLLTSEHRSTEGLYRLPLAYAADDLGWPVKRAQKAFVVLLAAGFVEYDDDASVVLIVNALKRQPPNPNQAKHAVKKLRLLPVTHLRTRFVGLVEAFSEHLLKAMREGLPEWFTERFHEPLPDPHSSKLITQEQQSGLTSNVVGLHDAKTADGQGEAA